MCPGHSFRDHVSPKVAASYLRNDMKVKSQALAGWHMNETITKEKLLPRSDIHRRGQAHVIQLHHRVTARQKNTHHNKGKIISRRNCYWDSLSGSISSFYKYGRMCPLCFGSKKKLIRKNSIFWCFKDLSRYWHLECSTGPLVTPEKVFQKFLRYFSGYLSFIKETKKKWERF